MRVNYRSELVTSKMFIHSGDLYSASSRHYYSEALPAQSWPKKNLEGWTISNERSSTGRLFQADGHTTKKALRCTVVKWARGTKSSPLAAERNTRRCTVTKVRGVQRRTHRVTIAVIRYCIR